jgi:hypothetical protein
MPSLDKTETASLCVLRVTCFLLNNWLPPLAFFSSHLRNHAMCLIHELEAASRTHPDRHQDQCLEAPRSTAAQEKPPEHSHLFHTHHLFLMIWNPRMLPQTISSPVKHSPKWHLSALPSNTSDHDFWLETSRHACPTLVNLVEKLRLKPQRF